MDQQEIEFREKNEKNKTFRKRLRNFYIGLYAPWGVMLLLMGVFCSLESKPAQIAILWVVCGIFVAWFVWIIYGIFYRMQPWPYLLRPKFPSKNHALFKSYSCIPSFCKFTHKTCKIYDF